MGLDVSVKGETVENGEAPVEEAADLRGAGSQLLDLNTILASYILVGELNNEVVGILGEIRNLRAQCAEVEIVKNFEGVLYHDVYEPVGLIRLAKARCIFI